jgi:CheY-like chemotaxis protein
MAIRRRKPTNASRVPDDAGLDDELTTLAAVLAHYPAGTALTFGSPSRCPRCGDYGLVGNVANDVGRCTNNCRVCRLDWTITRRALRAHRDAPVRPTPIGRGVLYEALLAEPAPDTEPETVEVPEPIAEVAPPPMAEVAPAPPASEMAASSSAVPRPFVDVAPVRPLAPAALVAPAAPVAPAASLPPPAVPEPVAAPKPPQPVVVAAVPEPVAAPPLVDLSSSATTSVEDVPPGPGRLRLLVVEDNPFDLTVLEDLLDRCLASGEVELTHGATLAEAEHLALSRPFDVVVLDLDLPDSQGLTTLLEWQHLVPLHIPLIALADVVDADLIREARALGVSQVIHRPQLEHLTSQGPGGQDRLHKLLRKTAASMATAATLVMPQPF